MKSCRSRLAPEALPYRKQVQIGAFLPESSR
jgi:hypothetical protein